MDLLRAAYEKMIEYGDCPAQSAQLVVTMEDCADRQADDVGWAYVAITGPEFSEAATVIVGQTIDGLGIRRPVRVHLTRIA